jgi:hypothetical protein
MLARPGPLELVPSKEVHRILRPAIEAVLVPIGFIRTGVTPAGLKPRPKGWWLKVADNRFAVVWLQLDLKYGFSREWGGIFTINFELSSRPIATDDRVMQTRWWKFLEGSQRKRAREIQRRVVAALPGSPSANKKVLQRWLMVGQYPWEELWARYGTVQDVHTWSAFLKETLPSAVSRFLAKALSNAR